MENERASSSGSSTDCSSNSENVENIDSRGKELADDEDGKTDQACTNLSLDLRSVLRNCDPVSEDHDSLDKLSAVLEQPENSSGILEGAQSVSCDREGGSFKISITNSCPLRDRVESLSETMKVLKRELRAEIELWKKEREELQVLREKGNALALEEATAAARAAAAAYAAESPLSNDLGDVLDITSEDALRELTILEYEKRLAKYQDEYSFTQAEKRYNVRWKMIANGYKQKLMEVERLCNEELEKVQKNVNHLQPLKEMISQWYTDEENRGDSIKRNEFDASAQKQKTAFEEDISHSRQMFRKIDAEVNMAPEIFVARFKTDDLAKKDKYYG